MMKGSPKSVYYYQVWFDESDLLAYHCVDRNGYGFDEYRFYSGEAISEWPMNVTVYVEGEHMEDCLLGGLHWLLVSDRVREIFLHRRIKGAQFLPVSVLHKTQGKEVGRYWALNVLTHLAALDHHHTRWLPTNDSQRFLGWSLQEQIELEGLNIVKPALLYDVVKDTDIFRLKEALTKLFISPGLKLALEQAQAHRGFKFNQVPAY